MAYEEIGIRMRADGVVETSNGVTLTGKAVEDLGKKLDTAAGKSTQFDAAAQRAGAGAQVAGAGARVLAGELANALPLPGAVGGALEGMAASGGAAMAGLSGSALAMGTAFVVGAAGVYVLTRAYLQGAAEAQAYTRAIVMSGNAAGTTRSDMADLARGVDAVVGTQRQAAAMMVELVSTAQVGRNGLQQFTEVGIRMERELGQAFSKTASTFAELGREPLRASIKLNEQHNYLTLAVYQQIKALQEQGKWTEAAALAQQTYADAMGPRLKTLEGNLGTLERAWRTVKDKAAEAWDAMLNVGREKTMTERIASVQAQIDALDSRKSQNPALTAQRRQVLVDQLDALKETERLSRRAATGEAERAAAVREGIKADQEQDKNRGGGGSRADPYAQLNEQIARRLGMAQAELDAGDKLSAADAFRVEMLREIAKAEKDIGTTKADQLRASVDGATAKLREVDAQRQSLQLQEQLDKQFQADRQAATRAAEQQTEALRSSRAALIDEGAALTLSKTQLHERAQAQLDVQIADKQARLERISGLPAYAEEATELQRQIGLLREVKGLKSDNFRAVQKQEEDAAYKQRVDSMAQSIEDGVANGFREGRSLSDIFFNELKAQAARTVLRVPIQMMANTATGWIDAIIKGIRGMGGGMSNPSGATGADMSTFYDMGPVTGGADGGSNYIERDMVTLLHKGEAVIPKEYNPAAGGTAPNSGSMVINFNPQISIDSRSDKAEVVNLVNHAMRQSQAQLLEMMQRRQA